MTQQKSTSHRPTAVFVHIPPPYNHQDQTNLVLEQGGQLTTHSKPYFSVSQALLSSWPRTLSLHPPSTVAFSAIHLIFDLQR